MPPVPSKYVPCAETNSTTAVDGQTGFTLASAATAVVGFMAEWSNLCPPTVVDIMVYREKSLFPTCKK